MRPRAGYDRIRYMREARLLGDAVRAVVLYEYGGPEKLKFDRRRSRRSLGRQINP